MILGAADDVVVAINGKTLESGLRIMSDVKQK
jgi:hypothetical protein